VIAILDIYLTSGRLMVTNGTIQPFLRAFFSGNRSGLPIGGISDARFPASADPQWGRSQMNFLPALSGLPFFILSRFGEQVRPRPGIKNAPRMRGKEFICREKGTSFEPFCGRFNKNMRLYRQVQLGQSGSLRDLPPFLIKRQYSKSMLYEYIIEIVKISRFYSLSLIHVYRIPGRQFQVIP
jgi:hypothetical protein